MPTTSRNRFTRHPIRTTLVLLTLVVLVLELLLRLLAPAALQFAHDSRQIYRYHPSWYIDFIPNTQTRFYLPLAEKAERRKSEPGVVTGLLSDLDFVVRINQHGFRVPSSEVGELDPDTPIASIHTIGDSFTMGWGVDYEDSYPARLQEVLDQSLEGGDGTPVDRSRSLVVNLGLNGFGALGATEKSLSLRDQFPPAAAIYLATENDYGDDAKARRYARLPSPVHGAFNLGNWLRRHSYLASVPFAARWWLRRDEFVEADSANSQPRRAAVSSGRLLEVHSKDGAQPSHSDPDLGRETKQALRDYASVLQRLSVPFLVVLHGDGEVVRDLEAFCREEGIATRRVLFSPDVLIPGDGHLNAEGNAALARFISPWLEAAMVED